jgi:Chaperone of endosialidase/Head domain of trimeric autotransporter adhesin
MKKNYLLLIVLLLFSAKKYAQNNVGIGTTSPAISAALDITATDKGVLIPRLTKNQRDAITTPATGLLIYQTDNTAGFYHYNSTAWIPISSNSQLEKITENGKTGYRILGRDPENHGNIGEKALDLSYSDDTDNLSDARGNHSIAMGYNTKAAGYYTIAVGNGTSAMGENAVAMGYGTTAWGSSAVAMGYGTTASGIYAVATGTDTKAASYAEVAVGSYNTAYSAFGNNTFNANDRAFGVGIGSSTDDTKDALIVYKSGNTYISNNGNTPATGTTSIIPNLGVAALQVRAKVDGVHIVSSAPNHSLTIAKFNEPTSGNRYIALGHINSNVWYETGSITAANGTSVSYNTTSDRRLKTDNGLYVNGLATLRNIKIHNYTWRETNAADIGVFAQELYAAYPNAVTTGDTEAETDPAKIKSRWQVDYSKLVPVLVAAVQELEKENVELKEKLNDLEKLKAEMEDIKALLIAKNTPFNRNHADNIQLYSKEK